MIRREAKKIKEDPEIIAAEKAVDEAMDRWKDSIDRVIKSNNELADYYQEERKKAREERKKKYGR